jgi:hypothetical protein
MTTTEVRLRTLVLGLLATLKDRDGNYVQIVELASGYRAGGGHAGQ